MAAPQPPHYPFPFLHKNFVPSFRFTSHSRLIGGCSYAEVCGCMVQVAHVMLCNLPHGPLTPIHSWSGAAAAPQAISDDRFLCTNTEREPQQPYTELSLIAGLCRQSGIG